MSSPNPQTLDLAAVLTGIAFPEDTVTVNLNEDVGYEIFKAEEALRVAEIKGNEEALKEVLESLESLREKSASTALKITVRGIPESTRKACDAQSREKFPVEYTFYGTATPDPDRDEMFNTLLWVNSLVKVEDANGAVAVPDEKFVTDLREGVGRSVISTISGAIDQMVKGTKSGFESAAREVDFLSKASPEG